MAEKAWAQIIRFKKALSPLKMIFLVLVVYGIAIYQNHAPASFSLSLSLFTLFYVVALIIHWFDYQRLKRQRDEATLVISQLRIKHPG